MPRNSDTMERCPSPSSNTVERRPSPAPDTVERRPSPTPDTVERRPSPVPDTVERRPSPAPNPMEIDPSPGFDDTDGDININITVPTLPLLCVTLLAGMAGVAWLKDRPAADSPPALSHSRVVPDDDEEVSSSRYTHLLYS